ncbi:MAG: aminoglycoside [Chitinophagaceae bacterium]|nr:MAG: aminoglycoside [Chitinophagaceae bacterium]
MIHIRKDIFEAIEKGYLGTIKSALNSFEIDNFYLSGEILIYMQAIRFLTDFLHNDRYYGEKYPNQNLVRAENQLRLLELYQEAIC